MKLKNILNHMGFSGQLAKLGTVLQNILNNIRSHEDRLNSCTDIISNIQTELTKVRSLTKLWVIFDTGGGSDINKQLICYGSTAVQPTPPTKIGYDFLKWMDADDEFSFETELTEDITLTAFWSAITYEIVFNANGGIGEMANQSFTHDEETKTLTFNAFTKDGYIFTGWTSNANGTGFNYYNGDSVQNLIHGNNEITINLYAQWQQTYTE